MTVRTLLGSSSLVVTLGWLVWVGPARPEDSYLGDSTSIFSFSDMNPGDSGPSEEGVRPLQRGPVHEAYAALAMLNPPPAPIAPKEPPAPVRETAPPAKPAGDHILWIPGYWAWDDEGNNFLWVSGLWRVAPPGRQWVAGHWNKAETGWQWASGFWAEAGQETVKLLPPPPAPQEEDPGTPPSDDSLFAPGCWVHRDAGYQWRDGFWYKADPSWVLVPAHYVWTPAGHVFIDQYWDAPLRERGLLCALVQIDEKLLADPAWIFAPTVAVNDQCLLRALFPRPSHGWYYHGDYFDQEYDRLGFRSWIYHNGSTRAHEHAYDPLYQWYRFRNRKDAVWETQLRALYVGRRKNTVPRPPRDLKQQADLIGSFREGKVAADSPQLRFGVMTAPVSRIDVKRVPAEGVNKDQQAVYRKAADLLRAAADQLGRLQAALVKDGKAPGKERAAPQSLKLELPKPPPLVRGDAGAKPPAQVEVRATTAELRRERDRQAQRDRQQGERRREEQQRLLKQIDQLRGSGEQRGPQGNPPRDNPPGARPRPPAPGRQPPRVQPPGAARLPDQNGRQQVQLRQQQDVRPQQVDRQRQLDRLQQDARLRQQQIQRQREQSLLRQQQDRSRQQQLARERLLQQQRLEQQQQRQQQQQQQQQLVRQRQLQQQRLQQQQQERVRLQQQERLRQQQLTRQRQLQQERLRQQQLARQRQVARQQEQQRQRLALQRRQQPRQPAQPRHQPSRRVIR